LTSTLPTWSAAFKMCEADGRPPNRLVPTDNRQDQRVMTASVSAGRPTNVAPTQGSVALGSGSGAASAPCRSARRCPAPGWGPRGHAEFLERRFEHRARRPLLGRRGLAWVALIAQPGRGPAKACHMPRTSAGWDPRRPCVGLNPTRWFSSRFLKLCAQSSESTRRHRRRPHCADEAKSHLGRLVPQRESLCRLARNRSQFSRFRTSN
jgi:hypothetical protein